MRLFILIHDPSGERVASYEGMDQTSVESLQTFPFDFIAESEYDLFVESNRPPIPTPAQILDSERTQAIGELLSGTQPLTKLQRSVLLAILSEINILRQRDRDRSVDVAASTTLADLKSRWAARSTLNDRTKAQVNTVIQNGITVGDAD